MVTRDRTFFMGVSVRFLVLSFIVVRPRRGAWPSGHHIVRFAFLLYWIGATMVGCLNCIASIFGSMPASV